MATDKGRGEGEPSALVTVHLLGVPLSIWETANEHADGLLREFALVAASARGGESHPPRQLLDLVDELERDYAALTSEQQSQLVAAANEGLGTVDLEYRVPATFRSACVRLGEALDAADRYCQEGEFLLSLVTPPDALTFRRWYLGEFVRQIEGHPPCRWSDWLADQPDQPSEPR